MKKSNWGIIIFKRIFIAAGAALAIVMPASAGAQSVAPGQSKADYHAWLAQAPENRQGINAFRSFLEERGVNGVIPVWQLVRTSSSWRQCNAQRFEVAPDRQWDNIVGTLAFVKNEVRPAIGEVEALSVFRNARLNGCSNGAPQSAHQMLFAVDLTPVGDMDRSVMINRLCTAHAQRGVKYSAGLGFYSGQRFHVDSSGFRKWGADGRGASSPCNGRNA